MRGDVWIALREEANILTGAGRANIGKSTFISAVMDNLGGNIVRRGKRAVSLSSTVFFGVIIIIN